jgi:hypothetical protein
LEVKSKDQLHLEDLLKSAKQGQYDEERIFKLLIQKIKNLEIKVERQARNTSDKN